MIRINHIINEMNGKSSKWNYFMALINGCVVGCQFIQIFEIYGFRSPISLPNDFDILNPYYYY